MVNGACDDRQEYRPGWSWPREREVFEHMIGQYPGVLIYPSGPSDLPRATSRLWAPLPTTVSPHAQATEVRGMSVLHASRNRHQLRSPLLTRIQRFFSALYFDHITIQLTAHNGRSTRRVSEPLLPLQIRKGPSSSQTVLLSAVLQVAPAAVQSILGLQSQK